MAEASFLLVETEAGKTTFNEHHTGVWCETTSQFANVTALQQFRHFFCTRFFSILLYII